MEKVFNRFVATTHLKVAEGQFDRNIEKYMDTCPDEFFIGVVKIFTFSRSKSGIFDLALSKIKHFLKFLHSE